jgi:hypothetical protein
MTRNHFIRTAIKHSGALHRQLGIPPTQKIPLKTLQAASKKGGVLAKRANLAITLRSFHEASSAKKS